MLSCSRVSPHPPPHPHPPRLASVPHRGEMQEPARDAPSNILKNLQSTQAPRSPSTQAPSAAKPTREVSAPQPRAKLIEMEAEEVRHCPSRVSCVVSLCRLSLVSISTLGVISLHFSVIRTDRV